VGGSTQMMMMWKSGGNSQKFRARLFALAMSEERKAIINTMLVKPMTSMLPSNSLLSVTCYWRPVS